MNRRLFLWAVLLILLLPPVIGVAAGDKSGNRPGKPEPPPPETATFRISIGIEGEHVVLTNPDSLGVVTAVEGWYLKGKRRSSHWAITLGEEQTGYFAMEEVYSEANGTFLTDFYNDEEAQLIGLEHHRDPLKDYWHIGIHWTTDLDEDGEPDPLILVGLTDRGPEPEGSYDATKDMWTVTFTTTNAFFAVGWCDGETCWIHWYGYLAFTVTIEKNPSS